MPALPSTSDTVQAPAEATGAPRPIAVHVLLPSLQQHSGHSLSLPRSALHSSCPAQGRCPEAISTDHTHTGSLTRGRGGVGAGQEMWGHEEREAGFVPSTSTVHSLTTWVKFGRGLCNPGHSSVTFYLLVFSNVVLLLKFSTVWNLMASLKSQVNPQGDWYGVWWRCKGNLFAHSHTGFLPCHSLPCPRDWRWEPFLSVSLPLVGLHNAEHLCKQSLH